MASMRLRVTSVGVAAVLAVALSLPVAARAQAAGVVDTAGENVPAGQAGDPDAELPIPPVPPRIAEGAQYDTCLDRLASDPSGADAIAAFLSASHAPEDAEAGAHCHALAQVELGNTEEGAALLDRLAAASTAPAASRAVVFAQASQAWTMAGHGDQAFASASRALLLSPDDPELCISHAIAALALQHYAEAADDLTHALELDAKRADALILLATSHRQMGDLARAQADISLAFQQDPDNPDGLLERGILRQRAGDLAGARADWQRATDLAADTPTGDLAQQNLALLAAGPRQ
jgi:tetratricopeptide (TPR) repeat protein